MSNAARGKAQAPRRSPDAEATDHPSVNLQHAFRPLHEMVRVELEKRVHSGTYRTGALLPSVPSLAEEFSVSAITVKRALRDLKMTGIVRSVAGLGTFVREQERFVHDLSSALQLFGSKEDALRSSRSLQIKLLSIKKTEIDEPALLPFLPPDQTYLAVEKVVLIDDIPVTFDRAFISLPLDKNFIAALDSRFIYEIVRERKMPVASNRILIDAAPAADNSQDPLGIPNGYPTLRRCYHFVAGHKPIRVYGVAVSPFDRVVCSLESQNTIET